MVTHLAAVATAAQATFGGRGVDIVVNNAGVQHVANVEDFDVKINSSSPFPLHA